MKTEQPHYAILFWNEEVLARDGSVLIERGTAFWVIEEESGWVEATSRKCSSNRAPKSLKTFKSRTAAERFMSRWKGHPWYNKPAKWKVVEVEPVMKSVLSHWKVK